jgi:hypothetical protein
MDFYTIIKELLIEATADEIYDRYYKNIDRRIFDNIVSHDPKTVIQNKKIEKIGRYSKLLLSMFINGNLKIEDLPKAKEYLEYVYKHQVPVNYNTTKTLSDLHKLISRYTIKSTSEIRDIIGNLDTREYQILLDGEKWLVVTPKTERAACHIGINTEWCTAWGKQSLNPKHRGRDSMFMTYNSQGPLYILINKSDETDKYQFHFESRQFMNEYDRKIDLSTFLDENEEIRRFFFPSLYEDNVSDEVLKSQINRINVLPKEEILYILKQVFKNEESPLIKTILSGDDEGMTRFYDREKNEIGFDSSDSIYFYVDTDDYEIRDIVYGYEFFHSYYYDTPDIDYYNDDYQDIFEEFFKKYFEKNKSIILEYTGIIKYEDFKNKFFDAFQNDKDIIDEHRGQLSTSIANAYDTYMSNVKNIIDKFVYIAESRNEKPLIYLPVSYFCLYLRERKINFIEDFNEIFESYCNYWDVPTNAHEEMDYYQYIQDPTYEKMENAIDNFFEKIFGNGDVDCTEDLEKFVTIRQKFFKTGDVFENEIVKITLLNPSIDCETKTIKIRYKNKETNKTYEGNVGVERLLQYVTNRPLMEEKMILNEETEGVDDLIGMLKGVFPKKKISKMETALINHIKNSDCKKIEIRPIGFALGLALDDKVVYDPRAFRFGLNYSLYIIFHEIAHQFQYKKYGKKYVYQIYLNEININTAVSLIRKLETVADQFAIRKLREFKKLGYIDGPIVTRGNYDTISDHDLKKSIVMVRNEMRKHKITDIDKVSETFYNYMVNMISEKK